MGDGGVVFDGGDAEARGDDAVDGRFPARARAADADLDLAHADLAGLLPGGLAGPGGGEGGALAGALEADGAGRVPAHGLAVHVGDGDQGVVLGRLDVGDAADDVLADLLDLLRHESLCGSSGPLGPTRVCVLPRP